MIYHDMKIRCEFDNKIKSNLKVDYLGFVFYEKSPRNISLQDIKNLSKYKKKDSNFQIIFYIICN